MASTRPIPVLVALSIMAAAAVPALAQQAATPPEARATPTELEKITVVAPRITYRVRRERGSAVPQEVTVAEKSAVVEFGDLDLTRSADLFTLEDRVNDAATRVCNELSEQFPEGEPSSLVCARRASDDAMSRVRAMSRQRTGRGS
jgi:UrcA family protein